jgi:hypothetical protein
MHPTTVLLNKKDCTGRQVVSDDVFFTFIDYFQLDGPTSASECALAIAKLAPGPHHGSNTLGRLGDGHFYTLWSEVFAIAEQIPHDHPAMDKLVTFMRELTLLPETGLRVGCQRLWTDLPVLGAAMREHLNGPRKSKDAEEQAIFDSKWVSFHAFCAKLMAAGVAYFMNQPIWMLRAALEEKSTPRSADLDRDLATAAMYIEYLGPALVETLIRDPEPHGDDGPCTRMLRGGSLFGKEKSGLSAERWGFWMRRFRDEAEKAGSEESKALGLRASRLMEIWMENRLRPNGVEI